MQLYFYVSFLGLFFSLKRIQLQWWHLPAQKHFSSLSTNYGKRFGNFHQPEKSLNSPAETPTFLFLAVAMAVNPPSSAAESMGALLAFRYFPTPPPPTAPACVPVPGLLYHDPTLSWNVKKHKTDNILANQNLEKEKIKCQKDPEANFIFILGIFLIFGLLFLFFFIWFWVRIDKHCYTGYLNLLLHRWEKKNMYVRYRSAVG